MDSLTRAGYVPGLEVVVDERGRLQSYVSGDARRSPRGRLTSSQRFYIGSVTKPLIATLVLQLAAADRLRLDDTVEQLLPGVLDTGNRITVADLLSHRSGLPDVVNDPRYHHVYRQVPMTGFSDPAQIVALVRHARLDFEPGSSASYSNTGFEVLGLIVEKITGRPLADVLQARIFGPLHLSSASLALGSLPGHPLIHGYTDDQAVWRDVTRSRPLPAYAAGYVAMDAPDLARFLDALFGRRVLAPAQLTAMRTVHSKSMPTWNGRVDYGYGLIRDHLRCGYAYGHSGRVPGYLTEAWTLPRQHRTVVVFANRADRNGGGAPVGPLIEETLCP